MARQLRRFLQRPPLPRAYAYPLVTRCRCVCPHRAIVPRITMAKASFVATIVFSCLFVLVGEASRGMVIGSLSTYLTHLGGGHYIGTTVALFSVGRLASSLLGGWVAEKTSYAFAFESSLTINLIGSLLYFFADELGLWAAILGRVLVGFGSGTLSIARAAVAEATDVSVRLKYMSILDACRFIGYAITPGLSWFLGFLKFNHTAVVVNDETSPGLVLALMNISLLMFSRRKQLCGCCSRRRRKRRFVYPPLVDSTSAKGYGTDSKALPGELTVLIDTSRDSDSNTSTDSPVSPTKPAPAPASAEKADASGPSPLIVKLCLALLIIVNLVGRGILALLEAIGPPIYIATVLTHNGVKDKGATEHANLFFLALGGAGLLVYAAVAFDLLRLPELKLLSLSFIASLAGCVLLVSFGTFQLTLARIIIGCGLIWSISAPMSSSVTISTFSKLVGNKPQGTYMGIITAAGSVGRIIFPLLADVLPHYVVLIIGAVTSLICAVGVVSFKSLTAAVFSANNDKSKPVGTQPVDDDTVSVAGTEYIELLQVEPVVAPAEPEKS